MNFDCKQFEERRKANEQRKIKAKEISQIPTRLREAFVTIVENIGNRSDVFKTCITCEHWKEHCSPENSGEQCSKFNCVPPPRIIADGCEYYEDFDPIPF